MSELSQIKSEFVEPSEYKSFPGSTALMSANIESLGKLKSHADFTAWSIHFLRIVKYCFGSLEVLMGKEKDYNKNRALCGFLLGSVDMSLHSIMIIEESEYACEWFQSLQSHFNPQSTGIGNLVAATMKLNMKNVKPSVSSSAVETFISNVDLSIAKLRTACYKDKNGRVDGEKLLNAIHVAALIEGLVGNQFTFLKEKFMIGDELLKPTDVRQLILNRHHNSINNEVVESHHNSVYIAVDENSVCSQCPGRRAHLNKECFNQHPDLFEEYKKKQKAITEATANAVVSNVPKIKSLF